MTMDKPRVPGNGREREPQGHDPRAGAELRPARPGLFGSGEGRLGRPSRPGGHAQRECGVVTIWAAVIVVVIFLIVGLVVDGGAMVHATQRADSVAREAARIAGQWVDLDTLGNPHTMVNQVTARERAEAYLGQMNCGFSDSDIAYAPDGTITVTCRLTYSPTFLGGTFEATGRGSAQPLRVN
jgi:Flp pilus assembly protein TadG